MSSLTSASTLAEIKAAYADNASYEEDADSAKARAFITACRLLLLKIPSSASFGASSLSIDPNNLRTEMEKARRWLALQAAPGGGVRFLSFEGFRD